MTSDIAYAMAECEFASVATEGIKPMSGAEMFIIMISWLISLVLAFWLGWKRGHDAGIRGIVQFYEKTHNE